MGGGWCHFPGRIWRGFFPPLGQLQLRPEHAFSSHWNNLYCCFHDIVRRAGLAAAQSFDDRWSIIPKAHAEPAPEPPNVDDQNLQAPPAVGDGHFSKPSNSVGSRSFNQGFSGKASYYSYLKGKTASGLSFNREELTAAHRNLPFGTRVRVTEATTRKRSCSHYWPRALGRRPRPWSLAGCCTQLRNNGPGRRPSSRWGPVARTCRTLHSLRSMKAFGPQAEELERNDRRSSGSYCPGVHASALPRLAWAAKCISPQQAAFVGDPLGAAYKGVRDRELRPER